MKIRMYYDLDKYYEYDNFKALAMGEEDYIIFFFTGVVMHFPKEIFNKVIICD